MAADDYSLSSSMTSLYDAATTERPLHAGGRAIFLDKLCPPHTQLPEPQDEDEAWRKLFIQPVPVPDLSHTGVRTQFTANSAPVALPSGQLALDFRRRVRTKYHSLPRHCDRDPFDMQLVDRDMRHVNYQRKIRVADGSEDEEGDNGENRDTGDDSRRVEAQEALEQAQEEARERERERAEMDAVQQQDSASHTTSVLSHTSTRSKGSKSGRGRRRRSGGGGGDGRGGSSRRGGGKGKSRSVYIPAQRPRRPCNTDDLLECILDYRYGSTTSIDVDEFNWNCDEFADILSKQPK